MPHDAGAPRTIGHRLVGRRHRSVDRVNLVVLGHDLPRPRAVGLEEDEVADEVKQPGGGEDLADEDLELRAALHPRRVHRLPLREVLGLRGDRAHPRPQQVGDTDHLDVAIQPGDRPAVVTDLVDRLRRPVLVQRRVLQLELTERQPVDVEQHVGPAVRAALDDRQLVDGLEAVVVRHVPIDQAGARRALAVLVVDPGDRYAGEQQLVEGLVVGDERGVLGGEGELGRAGDRLRREVGVEPGDDGAERAVQDHVAVEAPLGATGSEGRAVDVLPAHLPEPFERRPLGVGVLGHLGRDGHACKVPSGAWSLTNVHVVTAVATRSPGDTVRGTP